MKKLLSLWFMLAVALVAMAQGKLTPQAQISIAKQKTHATRGGRQLAPAEGGKKVMLVVKVSPENAAQTFRQMKAAGAVVRSKLGQQATVSIPADSVPALERIEGVLRIDSGHKGRLKTDKARQATGVSLLNGPTLPDGATLYSGKGVNICLIDVGIDFQHPAFKDSLGRSRIKCVYLNNSDEGRKFTVSDPEAGDYTFPGSVFDTPELIASLTTDVSGEYHGTHTAAIAAGTLSPQGFGGMAPDADLVLIPAGYFDEDLYDDEGDAIEEALAFAVAYANQSDQPTVLSTSMNSHAGAHDGSSSVTQAIEAASESLIPVFSAGNEGGYPIHLYQKFTSDKKSAKTLMLGVLDDETGKHELQLSSDVTGMTRAGNQVSVKLALRSVSSMGSFKTVWQSDPVTATLGGEMEYLEVSGSSDATLGKYFDGNIAMAAADNGDGRLSVSVVAEGGVDPKGSIELYLFELTISGDDGTEIDLWDDVAGFAGKNYLGLPSYVDGDSDISGGDWTSTERVVSVGAYCTNTLQRNYDGTTTDTSKPEDEDEEPFVLDDIAWFSSYGESFNGVAQPTVCAPGVNIVSAMSQYAFSDDADESMLWQGGAYTAESGTSMACPVVAGIVALWLEAAPTLSLDEVKEVMANSSDNDDFTSGNPIRWGYGKINAKGGIDYINASISGIANNTANSCSLTDDGIYDLSGRRVSVSSASSVTSVLPKGIYVHNGRKFVVK
ncbi:MAG: S8 family serine peptidase [Prevotella sp.]|nr:S8 family serine peptidase [Prevotella sp.]